MKIVPPLEALDRSAELRRRQLAEERSEPPRRTAVPVPQLVCDHLRPLLQRLVHCHGLRLIERANGLGCGLGFLFDAALPLDELANLPREPFVHVIASRGLVFCERCWQSLGEWKQHKDHWN